MLQATDELTIRMTAAEWNQVLTVLGDGPYRVVAPLIQKIQSQGIAQDPLPGNSPGETETHVPH